MSDLSGGLSIPTTHSSIYPPICPTLSHAASFFPPSQSVHPLFYQSTSLYFHLPLLLLISLSIHSSIQPPTVKSFFSLISTYIPFHLFAGLTSHPFIHPSAYSSIHLFVLLTKHLVCFFIPFLFLHVYFFVESHVVQVSLNNTHTFGISYSCEDIALI